jgi:hypothetical protein
LCTIFFNDGDVQSRWNDHKKELQCEAVGLYLLRFWQCA